jgi:hypothetical protein
MVTYNLAVITKKIYDSGPLFFTSKTLRVVLEVKKESTLFDLVKKLTQAKILTKIERDKYISRKEKINDFTLANFIYQPSYISFESALNFYGILSQFPYEITSATSKKTREKVFQDKIFRFTHIKRTLFWGYEKKGDFLIAFPEKALLDQLYLSAKGYKKFDLDEYDFRKIEILRLKKYLNKYPKTRQFKTAIKKLGKYIQ